MGRILHEWIIFDVDVIVVVVVVVVVVLTNLLHKLTEIRVIKPLEESCTASSTVLALGASKAFAFKMVSLGKKPMASVALYVRDGITGRVLVRENLTGRRAILRGLMVAAVLGVVVLEVFVLLMKTIVCSIGATISGRLMLGEHRERALEMAIA